jgi:hypothetical protein
LWLFGLLGLVVAPIVLLCWRQYSRRRASSVCSRQTLLWRCPDTLAEKIIATGVVAVGLTLILSVVHQYHNPPWRKSLLNMDRIGAALLSYHERYGHLPPTSIADDSGQPQHSWRVLILPQLGYHDLYERYRFDEPWNGPDNMALLREMPAVYARSGREDDRGEETSYLAIEDSRTAQLGAGPRNLPEISSGTQHLLVVEYEGRSVPWTSPNDITEDEARQVLTRLPAFPTGHWDRGFFTSKCRGRVAGMSDGNSRWLSAPSPDEIEGMVQFRDARGSAEHDRQLHTRSWLVIHVWNIVRLVVFVVVVLLPCFQGACAGPATLADRKRDRPS